MSSYQIPQFLDAGDKILGPLNMRQFGYALGGFLISTLVFNVTQVLAPGIGNFAFAPTLPVAGIFTFLAFGKFNGRDAEIYLYKFFEYNFRPRKLTYSREPYIEDLNKKSMDWSFASIQKRWQAEVAKQQAIAQNQYSVFRQQNAEDKARAIRDLSKLVNESRINALTEVKKQEEDIYLNQQAQTHL